MSIPTVVFEIILNSEISPNPKLPPELSPIVINLILFLNNTTGTKGTKTNTIANQDESRINSEMFNGSIKVSKRIKKKP
jgi:hypothetical protein